MLSARLSRGLAAGLGRCGELQVEGAVVLLAGLARRRAAHQRRRGQHLRARRASAPGFMRCFFSSSLIVLSIACGSPRPTSPTRPSHCSET